MIKIFNKVRRKSLFDSRVGKYSLYAIGEIILVVIGILIALQINILNQKKNQIRKTNTYLKALNSELNLNIERINHRIEVIHEDITEANITLGHLNSPESKDFNDAQIKSKSSTRPIYKAIMSRSTFDDLINSGTLEYLDNDTLKLGILNIEANIEYGTASFINAENVWTNIQLPYLMKYSAVATNWDTLSGIAIEKVNFKRDKEAFVYNRDYANILALRMRMMNNYETELLEIKANFIALSNDINNHLNLTQ